MIPGSNEFDLHKESMLAWKLTDNMNYHDFLYDRVSTYIDLSKIDTKTSNLIFYKLKQVNKWDKIGKKFSEYASKGKIRSVADFKKWVDNLESENLVEAIEYTYEISPTNDIDTSFFSVKYLLKPSYMVELSKKFGNLDSKKVFTNKTTGDYVVTIKENDMFYIIGKTQEDIDRFKLFLEQLRVSQ